MAVTRPQPLDPVGLVFATNLTSSTITSLVCVSLWAACGLPSPDIDPTTIVLLSGMLGGLTAVWRMPENLDILDPKQIMKTSIKLSAVTTLTLQIFFRAHQK